MKDMLKLEGGYFSKTFTYWIWMLMAFQAGYINVGGFFTSGNFVSHVTGTSSRIGMGLADLDATVLITFFTVLLAFIFGSGFAGYFIARPKLQDKEPQYILVASVKAFFFGVIFILSGTHAAHFPGTLADQLNILIIFFLSFCCGIQNATCALATRGFLKPTHMTGLSTDIGIFLGSIFGHRKNSPKLRSELGRLRLRLSILGTFIFGGVVATVIFSYNGHYGFLFPFMSSLCLLGVGIARDVKKFAADSWVFLTAKGSLVVTFLTTLIFGLNAYIQQL